LFANSKLNPHKNYCKNNYYYNFMAFFWLYRKNNPIGPRLFVAKLHSEAFDEVEVDADDGQLLISNVFAGEYEFEEVDEAPKIVPHFLGEYC
jgi:hypothetical protein